MHKIRQSQLMQIHQDLFEVASSWSQVRSQTLLKYVFAHGAKHALSGDQVQGMADLILDYKYDLERLRLSGSADLYGIVQDFETVVRRFGGYCRRV